MDWRKTHGNVQAGSGGHRPPFKFPDAHSGMFDPVVIEQAKN
jgi:hypothetical protein